MSHACSEEDWLNLLSEQLAEARSGLNSASTRIVYGHLTLAAEFAMKAAIARHMRYNEWPSNLQIHDLTELSSRGNLSKVIKSLGLKNSKFRAHWSIVRGLTDKRYSMAKVDRRFVREIMIALDDPEHGVIVCLSRI